MQAFFLRFLKKYAFFILMAAVALALWESGLLASLLQTSPQEMRTLALTYSAQHPVAVYGMFVLIYTGVTLLSLPVATFFTLIGGALFGTVMGTLLVVISATVGATLLFLIARTAFGDILKRKVARFYQKVEKDMHENAWFYLFSLRLIPAFPFVVVNILPALFPVSLFQFVVTTFFGIIPGTAVYVHLGATVSDISNVKELVSPSVLIAFALLGLLSLLPVFIKKITSKKA